MCELIKSRPLLMPLIIAVVMQLSQQLSGELTSSVKAAYPPPPLLICIFSMTRHQRRPVLLDQSVHRRRIGQGRRQIRHHRLVSSARAPIPARTG